MPLGGSLFVKQSMAKCQPHTCLLPTIDTIEISSAQIRGFARLSRFLSLSLSLSLNEHPITRVIRGKCDVVPRLIPCVESFSIQIYA